MAVFVCFQAVVVGGDGEPVFVEDIGQKVLVGEHVRLGGVAVLQGGEDGGEGVYGGLDDQESGIALGESEFAARAVDAAGVAEAGKDAVLTCPRGGVVGLLERVADAGVRGRKGAAAEGQRHELVHVLQNEHVGVQLDDALELRELEEEQLGPGVQETLVVNKVWRGGRR